MDWDRFIVSRLFFAVPELWRDISLVELLVKQGMLNPDEVAFARSIARTAPKILTPKGNSLLERLLNVAPELLSVRTVDLLRRFELISVQQGHALRIALRAGGALVPSGPESAATITGRLLLSGSSILSPELAQLIRDIDQEYIDRWARALRGGKSRLSKEDAEFIRFMVAESVHRASVMRDVSILGRDLGWIMRDARTVDNIWDAFTLVGESFLDRDMLKRAARLGIISQNRYDLINGLLQLGVNVWRKGVLTFRQESFIARAMLVSEGVLSYEMINALRAAGLISDDLARLLNPAASAIRSITRGVLSQYMKSTRVRALPGETAIQAYARVTNATDKALLRLLAEAADDARKEAERLALTRKFGAMTKSAQQRLVQRALQLQMRSLWENVGYMTIFGEKEAARAAISAMDHLQSKIYGKAGADLQRALRLQAESGIDSFVSRKSSMERLSFRVYKNMQLASGTIDRMISKALLRGLNARDFARILASTIQPNVTGGVSYAAMRLARTEINNAFHETSIRYTLDMPWVRGYKWNRSRSHPHLDVCDSMANTDHSGLGRGVYSKGSVPGKPHPQCLCYITTVTASAGQFEAQLRRGSYDAYLANVRGQTFGNVSDYGSLTPNNEQARSALIGAIQALSLALL